MVTKSYKYNDKDNDVVIIDPADMLVRWFFAPNNKQIEAVQAFHEKTELENLYGKVESDNDVPGNEKGELKALLRIGPLNKLQDLIKNLQKVEEEMIRYLDELDYNRGQTDGSIPD